MPRKRTSTAPIKEKARLRTTAEIQLEIRKLYRRFANKQITAAELKSRIATLAVLKAGMPDPIEPTSGYSPPAFTILAVPTNHFLTLEQIERHKQGLPIVDHEDCKPLDLSEDPPGPAPEPAPAPQPESKADVEAAFEAELDALQVDMSGMTPGELAKHIAAASDLMARAAAAGVLSDEPAPGADVIPMRGPRRAT